MDGSIRTILLSSKQKWQTGRIHQLIISNQYQYPPKINTPEEILISQYASTLKDCIVSIKEDKVGKKIKMSIPIIFAYLTHILADRKYDMAIRFLQGSIERNYVKNNYIVTYIVAKIYELSNQHRKAVFYLENLLKEAPFFNHAIFDLCKNYALQFNRQQEAIDILERHLSSKLSNDRHIQSLYLFLCGKHQLRTAKQVSRVMNGCSLTIVNYFNLALFLSHHQEMQRAAKMLLEIITKLTKARSNHFPTFTIKDRKILIMSKVNLLILYEKLSERTNSGQSWACEMARSLLQQRCELDASSIAKLHQKIADFQNKKEQLGELYFSPLTTARQYNQKTEQSLLTNKQNKEQYCNQYSDFRQYNNKKLKYLLMKQKQIDSFFKNIVIKKQKQTDKYKILYKSAQKLQSGLVNHDSLVKQAKMDLNQEDIQLFQQQFQEKRKANELEFNDMQLQAVMTQIIYNLSNCQPQKQNVNIKIKPIVNETNQSIKKPTSLQQSKIARTTKIQNNNRNLRTDRSNRNFRIKPTILKEAKKNCQNAIELQQKQAKQLPIKLPTEVTATQKQLKYNKKQFCKEIPSNYKQKNTTTKIICSNLEDHKILCPQKQSVDPQKQSVDLSTPNITQHSNQMPHNNIVVVPDTLKQPISTVSTHQINQNRSSTDPPISSQNSPPISSQTRLPKSSQTNPPLSSQTEPPKSSENSPPISSQTEPPKFSQTVPAIASQTSSVGPILDTEVIPPSNDEPKEPKYDPLMSSFQLTGINLNKSSFAKPPPPPNQKPIQNQKSLPKFKQKPIIKNEIIPTITEQAKTEFELQIQKAERLTIKQNYNQAFEIYTQMYKQFKKQTQKQLIMLKIAEIFEKQNKFVQAEKTYLKCTKFNNVSAFFKLGSLLLRNGRIKSGVQNIQKANCLKRNDMQIENKLIYGYSLQQQTMQKALNMAHNILRKEPQSLQTLIVVANILQKQGKVKSAIEIMIAIDECTSAEYIKHYLGVLHLQDSNITQAFNYFKEALNLKPDYLPSLVEVATIISDISPKQSIEILKKVLEIQPTNRRALARLAKIYESTQNDFDNAMATYKTALEAQQNYESYIKIGDCLVNQQSYIQALLNYQAAVVLRKTHEGYAKIASMYEKKGQYQKGIDNYQQALNLLSKQKGNYHFIIKKQYLIAKGKLNLLIFDYDAAISVFEDVLEQEESLEIFKLIAQAQFGKKQYSLSLEYYEKANQLAKGENIEILQNIAICFDKMEEYLASKAIYEKILEKDPQNIKCMNNLANILLITGQTNQAFYLFENMLQKGPKNIEKRLKLAQIYAFIGDWSKVEYHLLQCYHQRENDPLILQKLIALYKQKRDTKLTNKYQKKLGLLKGVHKQRKQNH